MARFGPKKSLAVLAATSLLLVGIAGSTACGTEARGVEACQRIERVRCESAPPCERDIKDWGLTLSRPVHEGDQPVNDVAACIRYYDDQCLHGIVIEKEPSPNDVDLCVDAIINGSCAVVKNPQIDPACAWLIPPTPPPTVPVVDAGTEAEAAADAATE